MAPATPSNSRTSRAASPPTPPMRLPPKPTPKRNTPAKKPAFSKSKYAEMVLIMGSQGREELHPLPRPHLQRNLVVEEDDDEDPSDEEDGISLPDTTEVIPRAPNYNPDLSDDDMSRSPSPFRPLQSEYFQHENSRYASHMFNVPSAAPESYFQKSVPRINELYVNKPTGNGMETVKTKLPVAYWKWPTGRDEHMADQERKSRTRENYVQTPYKPRALTFRDSEIPIAVYGNAKPPHINWIQRKRDAEEEALAKVAKAAAAAVELAKLKKLHRERMEANKDLAQAAVLASMTIDEDGFYKVKGTRKRTNAGIDLEAGRKRRVYIWKNGKPPLRGKALKAEQARLEEIMRVKMERRGRGEEVSDTEEEGDDEEEEESSDDSDEHDGTAVRRKPVKKVAKGRKSAVAARKSTAPKKPIARKRPVAKKPVSKKAAEAAKRMLLTISSDESSSDESSSDFYSDDEAPVKDPAPTTAQATAKIIPKKTRASRVTSSDRGKGQDGDKQTPTLASTATTTRTAPAKRPAAKTASKVTPVSARRTGQDEDDAEQTPAPASTDTPAKKKPAARKPAAKRITNTPESAISANETPEVIEAPTPAKRAAPRRRASLANKSTTAAPAGTQTANQTPITAGTVAKKIIAPRKKTGAAAGKGKTGAKSCNKSALEKELRDLE